MESLQNRVATHSGATPFFLIRTLSLASLKRWRWRSVKTGLKKNISLPLCALPAAWCDEIFQWLVVLVLPHGVPWSVGDASASPAICVSPGIKQTLWIRGCTIYKSWLYNMVPTFPNWKNFLTFPVFFNVSFSSNWKHDQFKKTRMHSGRMRTVRDSGSPGGLHQASPRGQTPPGTRHPPSPGPDPRTRHPPVERHTPVNILPCPKLRLRAVIIHSSLKYH